MTTTPVSPRPPHRPNFLKNQQPTPREETLAMAKYSTRVVVAWAIVIAITLFLLSAFDIHLSWPFGWAK